MIEEHPVSGRKEDKIKQLADLKQRSQGQLYDDRNSKTWGGYRKDLQLRRKERIVDGVVFDTAGKTYTGKEYAIEVFNKFILYMHVDITGTPTTLEIYVQESPHGNKYHDLNTGAFGPITFAGASGDSQICEVGPLTGSFFRIYVVSTGADQSNIFKLNVDVEFIQE